MSHGPLPHEMLRHDDPPMHSTRHDVANPQLTPLRHAWSPLHWTSHLYPAGQVTRLPQFEPGRLQSMVQVFWVWLHDVQPVGQPLPSLREASSFGASIEPCTMQKPLSQTRPDEQSEFFAHANSSLRCVIEQLAMQKRMPSSADFMVRLRR